MPGVSAYARLQFALIVHSTQALTSVCVPIGARDVVPGSEEVGEVWCRGPTVFAGAAQGHN